MTVTIDPRLITIALENLPALVQAIKDAFVQRTGGPAPTDAEVHAAYEAAFQASIDKGDQWLAAHPEPPDPPVVS